MSTILTKKVDKIMGIIVAQVITDERLKSEKIIELNYNNK